MIQWVQWLNENWSVVVVPILVFFIFFVAGQWLRKIAYDLLGRWGLNKRQDLLLAVATTTHGPLLHWFILLGCSVAIQISILPSEIKIITSKIVLSLLVFSLVWVAINLSKKIIQLYFPQIRLFLNKIRAPVPPIILLVNIARAVFIVIGLIMLLRIWGAPNVAGILVAAAVLIVSGLALRDVITNVSQNIRISPRAEKRYNRAIKLSLNLLVIIGLGEIARRTYLLFSNQADTTSSIMILLLEFGVLLWIVSILRSPKYKRVKPSFKLTTSSVIIVLLIFAFAGVQPMVIYKDKVVNSVTSAVGEWQEQIAIKEAEQKAERAKQEATKAEEESPKITPIEPPQVIIPEKQTLRNPSWEELKTFLWRDKTDQLEYVFPTFVCYDFARTLQANAKEAGWRCAYASVRLEGYPDWFNYGIPSNTGHGLNVFETADRGLVYIDCTSSPGFSGNADKIIDVKIGKEYIPKGIFPTPGWGDWVSMGTILEIEHVRW